MPLKPVDKRNAMQTREALWAAMREAGEFTVRQVRKMTRCSMDQTRDYVTALHNAGHLLKVPFEDGRAAIYILVKEKASALAPKVRKDGSLITQGRGREQMWRAMRVLGVFTVQELVVHATTEEHAVADNEAVTYCRFLMNAGYLTRKGSVYQFVRSRYSGPRPPMIQRVKQVYDPNLCKVVWSQGGTHDAD
ncbi:MAG: hypothetical protein AB7D06_17055 [Pedobacter sp.]